MSHRTLVLSTCLLLAVALAGAAGRGARAEDGSYTPGAFPDRVILTLSDDPATTQAVTWRTAVTGNPGKLEFAVADGSPYFRDTATEHTAITENLSVGGVEAAYHSVELTGLAPATLYAYRVGDGETWSEWYHFRTAADVAAPFSFIYFGDAQNEVRSMWSRVIRQAYSSLPDAAFMLHAGDLINNSTSDFEWGEWHAAGGWVNGSLPSIATPGNHEYEGVRLSPQWRPQFAFPPNGPQGADELRETVYYVDYQGVRIISLDTQLMLTPERTALQADWLRGVLSDNPNRWTIITHHYPMFAAAEGRTGFPPLNQQIRPLYEELGVDLVLQGHDHTYARGDFEGVRTQSQGPLSKGPVYVVSVSGPKMYDPADRLWADVTLAYTQVYQLIHIDGDVLRFEAYTATGQLFDSFVLTKNPDGTSSMTAH